MHVVLDIDWTLVSSVKEGQSLKGRRIIRVGAENYIVNDWVEPLVSLLIQKGVNVSFYSGGKHDRNVNLLEKLHVFPNQSLSFRKVAHRILSFRDLKEIAPSKDAFTERYKKDLIKVTRSPHVILVDDSKNFALQRGKMLWLMDTYISFSSFAEAQSYALRHPESAQYIPPNSIEFELERNKFILIAGILSEAIEMAKEGKVSLPEAIHLLSYNERGQRRPRHSHFYKERWQRGFREISPFVRSNKVPSFLNKPGCASLSLARIFFP